MVYIEGNTDIFQSHNWRSKLTSMVVPCGHGTSLEEICATRLNARLLVVMDDDLAGCSVHETSNTALIDWDVTRQPGPRATFSGSALAGRSRPGSGGPSGRGQSKPCGDEEQA